MLEPKRSMSAPYCGRFERANRDEAALPVALDQPVLVLISQPAVGAEQRLEAISDRVRLIDEARWPRSRALRRLQSLLRRDGAHGSFLSVRGASTPENVLRSHRIPNAIAYKFGLRRIT
jgi:hypothetical protein